MDEKIIEKWETPEGKKKLEKFIDEYIEKERIEKENIKSIVSNTDYVEWIYKFTKNRESFSDDEWLYCPEKISETNRRNVERLHYFYHAIEKYANNNFIYPKKCDFGNYYLIKYNDIVYKIGILVGQGTIFFCHKIPLEKELDFIDIFDVIYNKKNENVDTIKKKLYYIKQLIIKSYKNGVPFEAILNICNESLNNIKKADTEIEKKLKKTNKNDE